MAIANIFNKEDNRTYRVNFTISAGALKFGGLGQTEFFIKVSTTMRRQPGNVAFPEYVIRSLSDTPPGYATPATDFTDLCNKWIDYFVAESQLVLSSSSSTSSSNSSNSSSSKSLSSKSSSSSSSNSSSSSYIEEWSSSSSSYIEEWSSSSSSLGISSSSSSF